MSFYAQVSSIVETITCNDYVFLLEGNRHLWPKGLKKQWDKHWHKAPDQVFTVKEMLVLQGRVYSDLEQAAYILEYCVHKGWIPTFFTQPDIIKKYKEYSVSTKQLKDFFDMLKEFTLKVEDQHLLHHVVGHFKPTQDMNLVEAHRKRIVLDEAGHITHAKLVGVDNGVAMYQSYMDMKDMEVVWMQVEANRRPTGYEWRCPHKWYKVIPDIDQAAAKEEVYWHRTSKGRWYAAIKKCASLHGRCVHQPAY